MLQAVTSGQGATETHLGPSDVELRKVFKVYNGETAVRGVDLDVRRGEFFSILGPSGCGKTTTLRLVAGFEVPTGGEVLIRGKSMNQVPAHRRPVNTVFQSYALFNHLDVWDNIAFGLKIKRQGKAEIEQSVREVLQLTKLEAFAHKFPTQMSGGQQQRVALARALVNRPAVLLLDEPLGALDLKLRKQMQLELTNLHRNLGLTFIMVTHDQEEAMSISDRIAVMNEGRIEQIGTPSEIYEHPQTPFIADFIGDTNFFRGKVEQWDPVSQLIVTDTGLKIESSSPGNSNSNSKKTPVEIGQGSRVVVSIRPEKISLSPHPFEEGINCFKGKLISTMYLGTHIQCMVQLDSGEQVTVNQAQGLENWATPHGPIYIGWKLRESVVLSE
ncbi:MAG: ABC transporter ATP-binding protein [Oscillatoriales cyanobacterium RM2_1_1]|nr:ABC transporter ATP-binding protein [Oscillatoriales cyanobacterium SM2_3_0]NJO44485.1 ABC transporter ATP-binding protein [Oscillatoriales cyanobacterium RM2_1_1]